MGEKNTLSAALVAAIADVPSIRKDVPVDTGKFKYSYADLGTIMETLRPILAKHGLAIVQEPKTQITEGGELLAGCVTTILYGPTGEERSETLMLPVGRGDAQACGSAISYARRYALACVGVVFEDDDGQRAMPERSKPAPDTRTYPGPTEKQINLYRARLNDAVGGDRELAAEANAELKKAIGVSVKYATREQFEQFLKMAEGYPDSIRGPFDDLISERPYDGGK